MPLAPLPVVPVPSKPKMGFSIEALVGKEQRQDVSPPRSPSSPIQQELKDHCRTSQAPIAPVPTFPAGTLAAAGAASAAFLDSVCGGRGVLYPHPEHAGGYGAAIPGACSPHVAPFFMGREAYPIYPWLLARHPRFLTHRLPGKIRLLFFLNYRKLY